MKKQDLSITAFSSIQWLFFIFANTIVVPISIGNAFELPADTVATTIRFAFICTGIACVIQGLFGHKYPLMEGPSGMLWGLMLNLSFSASSLGLSFSTIGGGIMTGIILAGVVTILLATFNVIDVVRKIFSPMVMTVYLFLLTFQLIFVFFNGMFKLNEDGTVNIAISLFSFAIVILVSTIKIKGGKILNQFSILIGIVVGWALYSLLFPQETLASTTSSFVFSPFPLGKPNLEIGIVVVAFIGGLLNLVNTVSSVEATAKLYNHPVEGGRIRRSFFFTGVFCVCSTFFGLVPFTPFTSSIGFLQSTKIYKKEPFIISGVLFTLLGIIPALGSFLGTMPITIGNAVLFVAYLQLFGTAMSSLNGTTFNSETIFRLAIPVLVGVSIMNLPSEMFSNIPILISPFITNGLITGVIIAIILESIVKWDSYPK